ncbi:aminoglycoside phosphotransferase family protein [Microbacterium sp. 4R-513]|uniref:phosphotransferase n=1 Tax=Microbacterium sp. 4R-513 TaxID=2567934 RepID=UPI0013E1D5C2|nr:aminoglycoside phosphotransferase family protein [Microbacterium sp. 4R-513]QIG39432.1 aminoglycoside phosphotransferase family protein [Microbacterium sp. 4R-513]
MIDPALLESTDPAAAAGGACEATAERALLERVGLIARGEPYEEEPLTGGVSSDIRLVRTERGSFVLKRALERLKVEAEWRAPLGRVASEAAWLDFAGSVAPGSCPRVLVFDAESFTMALEYLDPAAHRNWKAELLAGRIDVEVAASLGETLGRIHAASVSTPGLAERFDNAELFEALRIEPYFVRTAAAVPEVQTPLHEVIDELRRTRLALVHGDVSPKNILVGPHPVILDAECATWGDPAFDVAFCLTHLELKAVHLPHRAADLHQAADVLRAAYLRRVDWEHTDAATRRVDRILPALLLARVEGASPVEYLDAAARGRVRNATIEALRTGAPVRLLLHPTAGEGTPR